MDNYQIARRAQIGVVIPSTNTGVEYDLQKFNLDGVSWHPSRFWIELRNWAAEVESTGVDGDTVFERFLEIMRGEIPQALRYVMSAWVSRGLGFGAGLLGRIPLCAYPALRILARSTSAVRNRVRTRAPASSTGLQPFLAHHQVFLGRIP